MWVGVSFGILAFVLIIFALFFFWTRRYTGRRTSSNSQQPSSFDIAETNSPGIYTALTNGRIGASGEENIFIGRQSPADGEIADTGRKKRETLEAWKKGYVTGGPNDPGSPRQEAKQRQAGTQQVYRDENEKVELEDTPVIKNDRRSTLTEEDGKRNRERFEEFKKGHRSVSMLNFGNLVMNEELQTFEDMGGAFNKDESRQSRPERGNLEDGSGVSREVSARSSMVPSTIGVPDVVGGTDYLPRASPQPPTPSLMSGTLGDMSYLKNDPGMQFYSQSPNGRGPNRVSELDGDQSFLRSESTPSMAAPSPVKPRASRQADPVEIEGDTSFGSPPPSNMVQTLEAAASNHLLKPANPDCDSE
ncbi:hypothetical protein B7494_g2959 [Chlorociboria aeruginascens]|nr:hypothetical protein B7494_g2959 [Chlorociboria aeruginascens]